MGSILGEHKDAHVLAIPYHLHGHIAPMLGFTTELARKGITISFVCFENAVPGPTSEMMSELRSLDFRFVAVPYPKLRDDAELGSLPRIEWERAVKDALDPVMEKFIHDKSADRASPTCIISDMFLYWTLDVAEKLQIPRYMFVTSGAIFVNYMQGCVEYFKNGQFQISETDGKLIEFDLPVSIPGLPPMRYHKLNNGLLEAPANFRANAESLIKSSGLLVNTFFELEERAIEAFQNPEAGFQHTKAPKIYPVGPFFSIMASTKPTSVRGLEDSSRKCLLWLGSQPSSSVLYIAFGSMARLSPEQVNELAHGLEASDQRFLLVLPQKKIGSEEESHLISEGVPQDFQARVGDRGCIVTGWAPQLQILAHSSTRGFMTHSGWNSSLESIILGVPMICWPQAGEQFLNCKYLVSDLKIAEQLQTGKDNIAERHEVERAVRLLMVESEGIAMRSSVQELKNKAAAAMAEGGSQTRFLQEFLDDIQKL